ncbi:S8 family peptidase [Rhodobacter sp. Har01]|uniref:S8 family peptidase n=1 Tax=Rhodobacter sp. Har01 TaxID=2883999 RepID=UPI001D0808DA|nr:S8 family peptidase [Rhodobacter sp. Har01]MCB6178106.1 S8 family peptidase [Rhodobacter sp. Har01]
MATRFSLPHIDISAFVTSTDYAGQGGGGSSSTRIRQAHGARLLNELNAALTASDLDRVLDDRLPPPTGTYIEVELQRRTKPDGLDLKTKGIKSTAVQDVPEGRLIALYVPDHARVALTAILNDYRAGPLTPAGKPPQSAKVEPIEAFRRARLETLWTDDPAALPADPQHQMWWAIWTERSNEQALDSTCERLGLRAAAVDRRLYFPEVAVVPVWATRAAIELMMFATGVIGELRRATDNPVFFMDDVREAQHDWSDDLASRIEWPGTEVPAVCLLDTGVNRGHALLEPAIGPDDLHTYDSDWGSDDHEGHGTAMAGIALHGDLVAQLADTEVRILRHRLESVKLLPPHGADASNPNSYGPITQAAVAIAEIAAVERFRIYCMAITNDGVSGAHPSTWSAAIDQAAAGTMIGDDDDDDDGAPRRLFVLSTGNTEPVLRMAEWLGQDAYPAEDPSQAWNAVTIGGYTELSTVTDAGYEDWSPLAEVGSLSPHSRTSVGWLPGRSPFKPELVLEAGNRAVSPGRNDILTVDSLCLLSTGREVDRLPLVPFDATSAATAQGARIAARIAADHPEYWPEMIRALMVHSAEYTDKMRSAFNAQPGLRERYALVRRFGYGVPDFERATASARDQVALIAQSEIQPFRLQGQRKFNECHYYELPLPTEILEQLGNEQIDLKVTLSYFVDPNPGFSANVDPQRYQSFGLRFDLRRKGETIDAFKRRVNASEREDPRIGGMAHADDSRWLLGPDSISAGSLHCDTWSGPAIDLLGRDRLCIKPVGGWWRDRARPKVVNRKSRYALVVTLKARRVDIDLHTPISIAVQQPVEIDVPL